MGAGDTIRRALGLATLDAETPAPVGDYASDVSPPARSASPAMTVDRALTLPSVFRAVQLIQGIGGMLGLDSWRRGARVDPPPSLVTKPDPWRSRGRFVRRYLTNAATDGNNFIVKHPGADGSVNSGGVELLNPFDTFIRWERRSGRWVKLYDSIDPRTRKTRTYTDAEILHVWGGLEVPGHDRALGPIAACRYALTGIIETRDYASGWFGQRDDDVPSGILKTDQRIDPETAAQYRKVWHNPQGLDADGNPLPRRGAGPSVRVLGQGLDYKPVLLNPSDAQWLESQAFGVLDVARMFGLPGDYLLAAVEGSTLTYTTLLMVDTQFARNTLAPVYLTPLEEAFSELLPHGQEARFDLSDLLKPDAKTRAEIDELYLTNGVYGADYVRARDHIDAPAPDPATIPAKRPAQEVPAR